MDGKEKNGKHLESGLLDIGEPQNYNDLVIANIKFQQNCDLVQKMLNDAMEQNLKALELSKQLLSLSQRLLNQWEKEDAEKAQEATDAQAQQDKSEKSRSKSSESAFQKDNKE